MRKWRHPDDLEYRPIELQRFEAVLVELYFAAYPGTSNALADRISGSNGSGGMPDAEREPMRRALRYTLQELKKLGARAQIAVTTGEFGSTEKCVCGWQLRRRARFCDACGKSVKDFLRPDSVPET
jgi:NADH pyrophosphatase NudC (nudix superfamily)